MSKYLAADKPSPPTLLKYYPYVEAMFNQPSYTPKTTEDYVELLQNVTDELSVETEDLSPQDWKSVGQYASEASFRLALPWEPSVSTWVTRAVQAATKNAGDTPVSAQDLYEGIDTAADIYTHGEDSIVCLYESEDREEIALIQRGKHDHGGSWMPPAGRVEDDEDVYEAATREMREEAGIEANFEHIGELKDHAYNARLHLMRARGSSKVSAGSDAADAQWVPYDYLENLTMTDTMYAAVVAGNHLDTIPHTDLSGNNLQKIDNELSRWTQRGQYRFGSKPEDSGSSIATLYTDNVSLTLGSFDEDQPNVWFEAHRAVPPADEIEIRRIGQTLTGTLEFERIGDSVQYSENDALWGTLRTSQASG